MLLDLTILIPHFNNWPGLARAVASCDKLPVLVYDDGSSEKQMKFKVPNVRIHYAEKNRGVASARDWLIKNCETRFGLFLDADDELQSYDYVIQSLALLKERLDVSVVGCFAVDQFGNEKRRPLEVGWIYCLWRNPIVTSGAVFRLEYASRLHVVDPSPVRNFAEDYYFWARLAHSTRLVNLPVIAVRREKSGQSLTARLGFALRLYVACYTRAKIFIFYLAHRNRAPLHE